MSVLIQLFTVFALIFGVIALAVANVALLFVTLLFAGVPVMCILMVISIYLWIIGIEKITKM